MSSVGLRRKAAWFMLLLSLFGISLHAAEKIAISDKLIVYVEKKYGASAKQRVVDWQKLIDTNQSETVSNKLKLANDFFNQVKFVSDLEHWGVDDYWATPVEMLATDGGDCEDFSIGKYFTLIALGIPEDKLRITYVKALKFNLAHMVLAYYETPDADPLVLDNLNKTLLPASSRDDLQPIYSFNGSGLWLAKERGGGRRVGGSDRLHLWTGLIKKMNAEANE